MSGPLFLSLCLNLPPLYQLVLACLSHKHHRVVTWIPSTLLRILLFLPLTIRREGGESRRELTWIKYWCLPGCTLTSWPQALRKGYGYLILQIEGWKIRGFVKGSDSTAFLERVKLQPHETPKRFLYFLGKEASYSLSWITFLLRLLHPSENSCLLLILKLLSDCKT